MAVGYKEFINSEKGITLHHRHITYRELLIVILTVIFLLAAASCCIVLIVRHGDTKNQEIIVNITNVCTSYSCLYSSAKLAGMRDASVNPCDDFYEYACGNWINYEPASGLLPDEMDKTMLHLLRNTNEDTVLKTLESPQRVAAPAFEAKIKDFFVSCKEEYNRTSLGGKPFVEQVIKSAYGWNVIGSLTGWSSASYDLTQALKKVHIDYWQSSLFRVSISTDYLNHTKRVVQIGLGGLTLNWWEYTYDTAQHQQLFRDTRKFMKTIASLVIRDSGAIKDPTTIDQTAEQFATDVFNFEATLANTTWYTLPSDNPHAHESRKQVSELNGIADEFDWVDILTTMFKDAGVNRYTKVVVLEEQFLGKLNELIKSLPNATVTLNNYFTWRLMLGYVTDLGWEYVHANREFYVARTGLTEFLGVPKYCFNKIKAHFSDGLGALYIRDHLRENDKTMIDELVKYLKMGLTDRLNQTVWLEDESKRVAIEKVKAIVEKVGYPKWMTDNDFLDTMYLPMSITKDNYLTNLIQIAKFDLGKLNQELLKGEDRSSWRYNVFDPNYIYDVYWNELLVAAGILQYPIYASTFPKYYNFGALGVTLAHELVHSIDEIGSLYLPNGTFHDWWSNKTLYDYYEKKKCLQKIEVKAGPYYETPDSPPKTITINGTYVAREVSAEMAALRIAFNGYKDWVKDNQKEKIAPGLNLTNEQILLLSFAQTQCFVRRDSYSIIRAERRIVPEDQRLNLALKHTPEFVEAYKCPVGSNMHADTMCEIF